MLNKVLLLSALFCIALRSTALAQNYNQSNTEGFSAEKCDFLELELPENFVVYAIGNYSGFQKLSYPMKQERNEIASQRDIIINSPSKPVIVMVGAYEPTVWNFRWTKGTEILGVLATGYHQQAVAGVTKTTPIKVSSYGDNNGCGHFYPDENNYKIVNSVSQDLFGRKVDRLYKSENLVLGEPIIDRDEFERRMQGVSDISKIKEIESILWKESTNSDDLPVASFLDFTAPKTGREGLDEALEKGLLRRATVEDIEAWLQAQEKLQPGKNLYPIPEYAESISEELTTNSRNYLVVLEGFQEYPAGLTGDASINFIIPEGVEQPKGDLSRASAYDINTGKCFGALCDYKQR